MRFTFIAAGWEGKDSKVLESAIADPMTNFPFSPNGINFKYICFFNVVS